jgi:hypothetical protein
MNDFRVSDDRHGSKKTQIAEYVGPDSHISGMTKKVVQQSSFQEVLQFAVIVLLIAANKNRGVWRISEIA